MKQRHLVFFDLDGTLIDGLEYSWIHMYEYYNIDRETTKQLFGMYMSNELTYSEWTKACVELLVAAGADRSSLARCFENVKLHDGASLVLSELKARGYQLFVVSGSVDVAMDAVDPSLKTHFDDVFINQLIFDTEDMLVGVKPTPYDMEGKALCIADTCKKYGVPISEAVFVGDNDNDVHAAAVAGISIAFNSTSSELAKAATFNVDQKDLRAILKHIP